MHSGISIDFLSEDDLTSEARLAPYKVLVITEPNVPAEDLRAALAWASKGGTLVTTSGAARFDRYNDPLDVLEKATGVYEEPRPRLVVDLPTAPAWAAPWGSGNPWQVVSRGMFNDSGPFEAMAVRSFARADTGQPEVRGSFADGSPAVLRSNVGHGHAVHFAFMPGLSYLRDATNWERLPRPSEFPASIRAALRGVAREAGALSSNRVGVVSSAEFVETPLLLSDRGAVLTLLNWQEEGHAALRLNVTLDFLPRRIESAEEGEQLRFSTAPAAGGSLHRVSLSVDLLDVKCLLLFR